MQRNELVNILNALPTSSIPQSPRRSPEKALFIVWLPCLAKFLCLSWMVNPARARGRNMVLFHIGVHDFLVKNIRNVHVHVHLFLNTHVHEHGNPV